MIALLDSIKFYEILSKVESGGALLKTTIFSLE